MFGQYGAEGVLKPSDDQYNQSVSQPSRYVDSHSNRVYLLRPLLKIYS